MEVGISMSPLTRTVEPGVKPVPTMVTGVSGDCTSNEPGVTPVITGGGGFTVKRDGPDVPPPGAGFATVTCTWPGTAKSVAVNAMVSSVALSTVVARALPPNEATEAARKPVPMTVTLVALAPAVMLAGERDVMVGTGLLTTTWLLEEPDF
jgi:hypothetical protein